MSLGAWGDEPPGSEDDEGVDRMLDAGFWPPEDAEAALALMKGVLAARGSLMTLEVELAKLRVFVETHGPAAVSSAPEPAKLAPNSYEEIGVGMTDKSIFVACEAEQAPATLRGPYADARRCKECGAAERRCCAGNRPYRTGCLGPWL